MLTRDRQIALMHQWDAVSTTKSDWISIMAYACAHARVRYWDKPSEARGMIQAIRLSLAFREHTLPEEFQSKEGREWLFRVCMRAGCPDTAKGVL
jgi:hypothetical protein